MRRNQSCRARHARSRRGDERSHWKRKLHENHLLHETSPFVARSPSCCKWKEVRVRFVPSVGLGPCIPKLHQDGSIDEHPFGIKSNEILSTACLSDRDRRPGTGEHFGWTVAVH